jgi:hypothetical protein
MGETQNQPVQLSFNSSWKVDFQGSWVTSDGGLIFDFAVTRGQSVVQQFGC